MRCEVGGSGNIPGSESNMCKGPEAESIGCVRNPGTKIMMACL